MSQSRTLSSSGLHRRNFLRDLSAGVAALALTRLPAQAKETDGQPMILGAGKHRYEWVRGWGKLPEGMQYGSTHGAVQVDSQGRIYVNTDTENAIIVFDAKGNLIKAMGKEWSGGTHGMQIRKEGKEEFIYLTNLARSEFAKIKLDGETVWSKGYPQQSNVYSKKEEFKPTGIAFAPNGDFYVTDGYGQNYIHHYNSSGEYVNSWGGKGTADGKFSTPHAIIIDTRSKTPTVLVTDRANHRLQWFDLGGKHLKTLPGDGDLLRLPATLHIRGTDLAVGDLAGRVTILDQEHRLITHLGDNIDPKKRATNKVPRDEWLDGQFIAPHGVCWDSEGNLYVEEWMAIGRVVKLKRLK